MLFTFTICSSQPTIYGLCKTDYTVKSREKIATDVTLNRDLSKCVKFRPVKDHTSPLALITGMVSSETLEIKVSWIDVKSDVQHSSLSPLKQHVPLAQLIRSTQTCNYKFDSERHHMTSGDCTEKHLLVPFSHKYVIEFGQGYFMTLWSSVSDFLSISLTTTRGEFGVTNIGKQTVTLLGVTKHNDRVFNQSKRTSCFHNCLQSQRILKLCIDCCHSSRCGQHETPPSRQLRRHEPGSG